MKIISGFKDYYDGIQSYGVDDTLVFERKPKRVDIKQLDGFSDFHRAFFEYGQTITLQKKGTSDYYDERIILTHIMVGFCGQMYFGYKFDTIKKGKPTTTSIFYSGVKAEAFLKEISKTYQVEDACLRKTPTSLIVKAAWFHSIKSPIFIFPGYANNANEINLDWSEDIPSLPEELIINPNLKQLDFQSVKDAYSCFQEINQFISGVLSVNENKPKTLTDKERIEQHGIDPKYGFRTRPKKKKQ